MISSRRSRPAFAAALLSLCLAACNRQADPPPPPAATLPPAPPTTAAPEAEQLPLQTRTEELEEATRQRSRAVDEQRADLKRARTGFEGTSEELTPEQRQLLADRIARERGSMRSLLQEILDQDVKIRELRTRLESLSEGLPASHVAVAGDRHDRIAMDYLISQGVSAQAAYQVVSKLNLDDALIPGFRVWTYYNKGQFGTWVTQGSAGISPVERQKRLREEAEMLRAESKALMGQNTQLRTSNENLKAEVDAALKVAAAAAEAKAQSEALATTVQYAIGTKKGLEGAKVIDGRLRLLTLDIPDSQPLNLAARQTLTFEPLSYSPPVKRVKRVRIAPTDFVDGADYSVTALGDVGMELRILNPQKFIKAGRFLVVIE
jgi:hypothetical protein